MKEYRLERITYIEAEEYAKKGAIVLFPISPLEAHGPHLPLSVDFLGARTLAEMSAEKLNRQGIPAVVAPLLPYALANAAMPFAGTVTLSAKTVKALISEIAASFMHHGFKGMVIICQHLERQNLNALEEISKELSGGGSPVCTVNPIKANEPLMQSMMKGEFPELDVHAGEWETAFCLWKCPDLVKKHMIKELPPIWVNLREKLYEQGYKDFVEAGGSQCYFGDPSPATPELGEKIYNILADALTKEVVSWLKGI
ncbi:MAG: creatininase family protein [Deltaproteobacteria bacterium]|nr:creatininase family protein [Deltaproteobacteria bacterium]